MSRNVSQAASGAVEISTTIGGVTRAAELAAATALESQRAVEQLADMSMQLNDLVAQFKINTHDDEGDQERPRSHAAAASK